MLHMQGEAGIDAASMSHAAAGSRNDALTATALRLMLAARLRRHISMLHRLLIGSAGLPPPMK